MSLFVYESGKQPSDLTSVVFERVTEDSTSAILKQIVEEAGYHPGNNPHVTATVTPDQDLYAKLGATAFGKMLRWLNTDFGVPTVTSYVISGPLEVPFLEAKFG